MSCKQFATLSAFAVLVVLLLNLSFTTAASSESAVEGDESKSYFGYQPKPKDSYKKLVEDVNEFVALYSNEWTSLWAKIEAVNKKLYHRKDKDHGGYDYSKLQKMQQLLSEQKATIDALRSDRIKVPAV